MRLVLDTYALMAYLRREPGHDVMRRLFQETLEGQHQTSMSIINLGELFYMQYRKSTPAQAYRAMQFVRRAGIRVEAATNERVMNADECGPAQGDSGDFLRRCICCFVGAGT